MGCEWRPGRATSCPTSGPRGSTSSSAMPTSSRWETSAKRWQARAGTCGSGWRSARRAGPAWCGAPATTTSWSSSPSPGGNATRTIRWTSQRVPFVSRHISTSSAASFAELHHWQTLSTPNRCTRTSTGESTSGPGGRTGLRSRCLLAMTTVTTHCPSRRVPAAGAKVLCPRAHCTHGTATVESPPGEARLVACPEVTGRGAGHGCHTTR
jgi:hypothetical protein